VIAYLLSDIYECQLTKKDKTMDLTWGFLNYLAAYRLSIIGVGALSIILGYRLFCKGLYPHSETETTEFQAKIGDSEFSLTSAGPGLFFALFGVIVISVMIAQGNPELILNKSSREAKTESHNTLKYENVSPSTQDSTQVELTMRGNHDKNDTIQNKINQGIQMERDGNIDNAIALYREALLRTTPAMNGLAWLYFTEYNDKLTLAKNLSFLSVQLNPKEANYWDTYAEILFKEKQYRLALSAKKRAADLDPSFNNGMEKFKKFNQ